MHAIAAAFLALFPVLAFAQASAVPPRTVSDIVALLGQYQPHPERVAAARKRLETQLPEGLDPQKEITFLYDRSWAAQQLGDTRRQIADLVRALELAKASPQVDQQREILQALSNAQAAGGNLLDAIRTRQAALALTMGDGARITLEQGLITQSVHLGDLDTARASRDRLERLWGSLKSAPHWRSFQEASASLGFGVALTAERKYAEAETALRRSVTAIERDQQFVAQRSADMRRQGRQETEEATREISARNWDGYELWLAEFLLSRDRLNEAELTVRNILVRALKRLGRDNVLVARVLATYAKVLTEQGRYREAEQMALAAIESYRQSGAVPETRGLASARRQLGASLVSQSKWPEALAAYRALRDGLGRDPGLLRQLGAVDASWALALVRTGGAAEAAEALRLAIPKMREFFGADSQRVALLRGMLALALSEQKAHAEALAEFKAAMLALLSPSSEERDVSPQRLLLIQRVLEGYIRFLHEIRGTDTGKTAGFDPAAEAFRVADAARNPTVQRALTLSAARAAVNDPELAALVRKEQDLQQETHTLYEFLFTQMNLAPDQQLPKVIADMRKRIQTIERERRAAHAEIERRFPAYANLVSPRPASLEQARAALRPNESLVSVHSTADTTYVWAVNSSGETAFHAAPLGEARLAKMVAGLRRAMDLGDGTVPAFDFAVAHELYAQLLAPVEPAWGKREIMIASLSGALAQLPLSVLVTAAHAPAKPAAGRMFADYEKAPWLARRAALVYVPSISAFARLRTLPAPKAGRAMFAGFGDPLFDDKLAAAPTQAAATRGLKMRSAAIDGRDPKLAELWTEYRSLAPLPDTREELISIARVLGASEKADLVLGRDATRKRVLSTDLSSRQIVMFATHGLVPGDLPALEQPALALAATADAKESPLLTLEDVLTLKLNADWVVLSACNTAAADGQGAEAISGLGRGFFYAGTRALLVTHWPVETTSARLLTTGIFERYAKETGVSRALAVNHAMLALLDSGQTVTGTELSFAHPLFWAPYALIGDGGR